MRKPLSVFVFGEAMIELSRIEGDRARLGVAGDTFNTAVYLARLGLHVQYVTALGDCPFSDRIRQACEDEGVGTDHILTVPGGTPGLYAVSLDDKGERSFTYWRSSSAARHFFEADRWQEAFGAAARADLFYLSGITLSLFDEPQRAHVFELMGQTTTHGGAVAFDGNYRPRGWRSKNEAREAIGQAIAVSTITLPTLEDEQELFGDQTAEKCAERHWQLGARETCVKQGARGAYHSEVGWIAPPKVIKPMDTTGAGDSFNAGFLAARSNGQNAHDASYAGHCLAAKVLQTPGAILPLHAELEVRALG